MPAAGHLAEIHDRMPLALPGSLYDAWLNPDDTEAQELLQAAVAEGTRVSAGLERHPVGPAVGSVRNNSPGLIRSVEDAG